MTTFKKLSNLLDTLKMKIPITNEISLEEFSLDYVKEITFHINNRKIYNNTLAIPFPYTEKHAEDWVHHNLELRNNNVKLPKNLVIKHKKLAIGGIGVVLKNEDFFSHQVELGYWLSEDYWGTGVMTQVIKAYVEYCFSEFPYKRLMATVFQFNLGSQKVLLKNGFKEEGLLRQYVKKDAKYIDCLIFSKLRNE